MDMIMIIIFSIGNSNLLNIINCHFGNATLNSETYWIWNILDLKYNSGLGVSRLKFIGLC